MAVPAATILGAVLVVLPPRFTGQIIDALSKRDERGAMGALGLYVGTTIVATIISLLSGQASRFQRDTVVRNLRLALFARLHTAKFESLSEMSLGEISNRILGDVQSLSGTLEYSIFPAAASLCTLVATIVAMAHVDLRLAAVGLFFSFSAFIPQLLFKSKFVSLQRGRAVANDELYGIVTGTTTFAALVTLRAAAASRRMMRQLFDITDDILRIDLKQGAVGSAMAMASSILSVLGPTTILVVGADLASHGRMSPGTIVTLLIYQSRMLAPFSALSQMQIFITGLGITTHRLLELADLPQESTGTQAFTAGDILWNGVYAARNSRVVLKDIDLLVRPGEHIAIVGESGAGKSTLAASIVRYIEPNRGAVKIAGVDVRELSVESLRAAVCIVEQNAQIFDGSLLENITLKTYEAATADVEDAVRLSQIDSFINKLPEGLNTLVGPRGIRLSGGEQQRICLARALLQKPDILILDEALTGVDSEAESTLIDRLRRDFRERILIVITHRLSAVARFGRIIVMSNGGVVAQGSHDELQALSKWYNLAARTGTVPDVAALC